MMNKEFNLFSRHSKSKKLDIISSLTPQELLSGWSQDIITRILKEKGAGKKGCRDRTLILQNKPGNYWNSSIESIHRDKSGKLWIYVYVQYGNTDSTCIIPAIEFFGSKSESYRGSISWTDRYGGKQTSYYTYSIEDKAEVLREIYKTYLGD